MEIPESNYSLMGLCIWSEVRDEAEEVLLIELHEASMIAENMRDYWKHQNCQAEVM